MSKSSNVQSIELLEQLPDIASDLVGSEVAFMKCVANLRRRHLGVEAGHARGSERKNGIGVKSCSRVELWMVKVLEVDDIATPSP